MSVWRKGLSHFEAQAIEVKREDLQGTDIEDLSILSDNADESDEAYESDFIDDTDYPLSQQQIAEFHAFGLQPSRFKNILRNRPAATLRATWNKIENMAYQQKNRFSATDRLAEEALANRRPSAPRKTNTAPKRARQKTTVTRKPDVVADSPRSTCLTRKTLYLSKAFITRFWLCPSKGCGLLYTNLLTGIRATTRPNLNIPLFPPVLKPDR